MILSALETCLSVTGLSQWEGVPLASRTIPMSVYSKYAAHVLLS